MITAKEPSQKPRNATAVMKAAIKVECLPTEKPLVSVWKEEGKHVRSLFIMYFILVEYGHRKGRLMWENGGGGNSGLGTEKGKHWCPCQEKRCVSVSDWAGFRKVEPSVWGCVCTACRAVVSGEGVGALSNRIHLFAYLEERGADGWK